MLLFFKIPKSNYYRWKTAVQSVKENDLVEKIHHICRNHKGCYGYRRVQAELMNQYSLKVNHKKVQRIMREENLLSYIRRKKFRFFKSSEKSIIPDLIQRNFKSKAPCEKWYTDVSTFTFGKTPIYLSAIIDGYNNEVISYQISSSPNLKLAIQTLKSALDSRKPKKLILHSDQGSIYTSIDFQNFLKEKNIIQSMSRIGVCYDNVLIESFFSHLKVEAFYSQKPLRNNQSIKERIEEYIYYYNHKRIQLKLDRLSPIQFRKQAYSA